MHRLLKPLFTAVLLSASAALAVPQDEVNQLLAGAKAPPGVVFEIVGSDPGALEWAVPQVRQFAQALRQRFPGLAIAVVTYGDELFALQKFQREARPGLHQAVQTLATRDAIPVHVCENHASTRGVRAEAFPDYVTVASSGPVQVNNYIMLGFVRVKLEKPASSPRVPGIPLQPPPDNTTADIANC